MKSFSKLLLAAYTLLLSWLVLFKLSLDIPSVLALQIRSLNLIPFAGSPGSSSEMVTNILVFIPLGLLLGVNFKQTTLWRKLSFVFIFSLTAELIQFVLAIGITDITDVIMNTFGGLIGLIIYRSSNTNIDDEKHDRFIVVAGAVLVAVFILLRVFVLRVRY